MAKTREHLIHLLSEASEIEHNLLCSYLYAAASIKKRHEGLQAEECDAVERWHQGIMSIAIEEMGHLALVNNLLVAVGGAARFDRPNFPVPPGYHPANIRVRLTPFTKATLQHFIYLERPDDVRVEDHEDFLPKYDYVRPPIAYGITPSTPDYETVGEFYTAIKDVLHTVAQHVGNGLFVSLNGTGQIGPDIAQLPGLIVIADLPDALRAIETIIEQGEGAPKTSELCHFTRFLKIRNEWEALEAINPSFEPSWPAAADPVMRKPVVKDEDRVWISDPHSSKVLDLANATYGLMLSFMEQGYVPFAARASRSAYFLAAMKLMRAINKMAEYLARQPAGPEYPGINGGMTFAVPRNLRPLNAKTSTGILAERLSELKAHASCILQPIEKYFLQAEAELTKAPCE